MNKAAPSLMPQKFSHKFWDKREKYPKQRKNPKLFLACFWTSINFILVNFFFKLRKKISRLFSGHKWCKFHKKKSWKKFSVCPWKMRGSSLQSTGKILLTNPHPPTSSKRLFLLQKSFSPSKMLFYVTLSSLSVINRQ